LVTLPFLNLLPLKSHNRSDCGNYQVIKQKDGQGFILLIFVRHRQTPKYNKQNRHTAGRSAPQGRAGYQLRPDSTPGRPSPIFANTCPEISLFGQNKTLFINDLKNYPNAMTKNRNARESHWA